ncbi:DUF3006 domain-containing protein [Acetonema longum]|uniref:DUF3006 domain-containing protein n=1 Tax=Acetonema longum DSM 6540 TaxID=1009370 RepID=F7NI58_9FIRM|nr:DUF3006 domain-containing protein [Acetonema longum]EGO64290.1 hypothetical protein ALO_08780 [Acetonema longum DSM 6540]
MQRSKQVSAVIDRMEGKKAVLLVGAEEKQVVWLREFLPEGVQEGDHLVMDIGFDEASTEKARKEAEDLLKELTQGNN